MVGPEATENGEVYSAANDREQAGIVYRVATQIVRADPELSELLRCIDSTKTITCPSNGSFYRAVSSESGTKHGLSPTFVVYDELAQAKSRELYDVMDTSFGARTDPLFCVISTQSNDPEHILSKLIDDGLHANDPRIVCHLYAVPEDTKDIFDPKVWKMANPALGDFLSLADMKAVADKAERMPAEEPKFRNLRLNQRVAPVSSMISRKEWMAMRWSRGVQSWRRRLFSARSLERGGLDRADDGERGREEPGETIPLQTRGQVERARQQGFWLGQRPLYAVGQGGTFIGVAGALDQQDGDRASDHRTVPEL